MKKNAIRAILRAVGFLALLSAAYAVSPPFCGYLLFAFCIAALFFIIRVLIETYKAQHINKPKGKTHNV